MTGHRRPALWITLPASVVLFTVRASAATPAFDSAADPVYDDGWQAGDNGGSGWGGGWTFGNLPPSRQFIGNSAGNGDGDTAPPAGDINTPRNASGRAWGLANSPRPDGGSRSAVADRLFNGDLAVGQTFSVDFDNGTITGGFPNGVGIALWRTGRGPVCQFEASGDGAGGSNGYRILDMEGSREVPGFNDEGVHIELTLLPADTYSAAISPLGGAATTYRGTLFGAEGFSRTPNSVRFYDLNGGNTPADESFYNNLRIGTVPEAGAALALNGTVGLTLLRLRRRRA